MKKYNCPDCGSTESCDGCPRISQLFIPKTKPIKVFKGYNTPNPCEHCGNHPDNGGSGICLCTLGLPRIT